MSPNWTILMCIIAYTTASLHPTAYVAQGKLTGLYMTTINNRKVSAFLGVPYASPPIGKYRFKEPVPAEPWIGVYNATELTDLCLQYSQFTYTTKTPVVGSEDCLYLNIYTPKLHPDCEGSDLDVLVFIHGGAFMFATASLYGPEYLLQKDIILVAIEFRVGALGFLSMEDSVLPGNLGMKDQVLALKWIKKNIAAFGGNPNKITLSGFSSGGAGVEYHMMSPLTHGLFNKAIALCGSALNTWTQVKASREKAMKLADYLGCPTNDSFLAVQCLRQKQGYRIVAATKLFMPWMYIPFSPFAVVVEPPGPTAFISEHPIDIILQKKVKDIPLMMTMDQDEGLYPGAEIFARPEHIEEIDKNWNEYLPLLLDYNYTAPAGELDAISQKIRRFYLGNARVNDQKRKFIKMIGDRLFFVDIIKSAKLHAQNNKSPVYSYIFSHKGSRRFSDLFNLSYNVYNGTGHGDHLGYVLRANYMPLDDNPTDMTVSKRLIDYWLKFIKGEQMPRGWPDVKKNLPNFGFLEIQNADENNDVVRIKSDYGNEKFWSQFNFNENIPAK